jgi:hypothetical protein
MKSDWENFADFFFSKKSPEIFSMHCITILGVIILRRINSVAGMDESDWAVLLHAEGS